LRRSLAILEPKLGAEHADVAAARSWLQRAEREQEAATEQTLPLPTRGAGRALTEYSGPDAQAQSAIRVGQLAGGWVRYAAKRDQGIAQAGYHDTYLIHEEQKLFVIADGSANSMFNNRASQVAAGAVAGFFVDSEDEDAVWPFRLDRNLSYNENRLVCAIRVANRKVYELAMEDSVRQEFSSSIVGCLLYGDSLFTAWVGHSRAYRLRQGQLQRLTRDHTFAEWMRDSVPTLSEAQLAALPSAHQLRRALGLSDKVAVDVRADKVLGGDLILLCSDGLTGMVDEEAIADILLREGARLEAAVEELVDLANHAGGTDNISAILIRVAEG
jgi:protein phosphatase